MANLKDGNSVKFLVVNKKFLQYLSISDQLNLSKIVEKLNKRLPKLKEHNYIVINTDEPYVADEVIEIMKRNGHWGWRNEQA